MPAPYDRRAVFSWALYDFANSAYTTLIVTFIYATFFTEYVAPPSEGSVIGTALWANGVTISALLVAVLSPILGAFADRGGYRKLFLGISTVIGVVGAAMLYFPLPFATLEAQGLAGQAVFALTWFVIGNTAFEMGVVFNNAFLPDLAPQDRIGRISGFGWALGYVGGLACMFIALYGFVQPDEPLFGLSKEAAQHVRATNLLVAVWFGVFSLPMFLFVKEDRSRVTQDRSKILKETFAQLGRTFGEVRRYRQVVRLLLARLFYNDGLVTIFAFGAIYAEGTFDFTTEEIIVFGIMLNITAGIGSFVFGFFDDRLGGKRTLMITIVGLITATMVAIFAPNRLWFWISGILVGLFVGPNQSSSRALLGRFVPPDKENEFFGFYAFSGKATAFLGPALLGAATLWFGTQRAGIAVVLLFFVAGLLFLLRVDEAEGIALANRPDTPPLADASAS